MELQVIIHIFLSLKLKGIRMSTFDSSIGDKFCADTFEDAFTERPLSA